MKPTVIVIGWLPMPANGRTHVVTSLLRPPFSDNYRLVAYDTRMRDDRGGSRPGISLVRSAIGQLTGLSEALAAEKPEAAIVCIGPGSSFWRDLLILRACHRAGLPCVVRFFGGVIVEQIVAMPAALRTSVTRQLARAAGILVEMQAMADGLGMLCPDVPVVRTPNFIDLNDLPVGLVNRSEDSGLQVVYFGNMTPSKGVEAVLASVDHVCRQQNTDFHFIGGELKQGYLDEFRAKAAQMEYAASVHIHGRLPRQEAHALASRCHIFAFPTQWPGEGQPAALLEAMGMGLVPIVTPWRGVAEIVRDGHCGLCLPPGPPDAIALGHAILRLADDRPLLRHLSAQAQNLVAAAYTPEIAFEQYEQMFQLLDHDQSKIYGYQHNAT